VGFCEEVLGEILTPDMRKMLESVVKNPITIAISGAGVGKTIGAAMAGVWFRRCFSRSQVYMASCPPSERNLNKKLWGELRQILRRNPGLFSDHISTHLNLVDKNNDLNFIAGVTIPSSGSDEERESKFSGAHAPAILFVLDEGDAIFDVIYRAIDGCMSGGFARLLVMFNPKRKAGYAYKKIQDRAASVVRLDALKHPNVLSGEDLIPGAVTRDKTVERINEWTKPLHLGDNPDGTCFEVPGFLVGSTAFRGEDRKYEPLIAGWRRIENPEFYYKVLGEYPAAGSNQLINEQDITDALSRWRAYVAMYGMAPPVGIRPVLGMDVADEGGDYNTLCVRYGGWLQGIIAWRGMDVDMSATKAAGIHAELHALVTNVESDGLGAGVAPKMNRTSYWYCTRCRKSYGTQFVEKCPGCEEAKEKPPEEEAVDLRYRLASERERKEGLKKFYVNAKKVMVSSAPTEETEMGVFGTMRDQLWWSLREWLRMDSGAMLPPDEELLEELRVPTYEIKNGKVKVMSKDLMRDALGRSPDRADSLIQTFYKGPGRPRVRIL